jgi:hypothetical protein
MEPTKNCTKCKVSKPLSEFCHRNGKPVAQCRTCRNNYERKYRERKRDEQYQQKVISGEIVPIRDSNNICINCKEEKNKSEFHDGKNQCKECIKLIKKEYNLSQRGREKNVQWIENNRESVSKRHAEWHQQNKERLNEKQRERYHSDPIFRLKHTCRNRIQNAFNTKDMKKSDKTVKYLNCSIPELIDWFKFCFTLEMTLENHGEYWHMDHVIPINLFNLNDPEQIKLCFSWYNVSPLQANENMSKSDRINVQQVRTHVQKLVDFNKQFSINDYIDLCAKHLTMTGNSLELYLPLQ